MKIRKYEGSDLGELMRIHTANGLPENCFPELVIKDPKTGRLIPNPLFVVSQVAEHDGEVVMGGFIKLTAEAYLILDHEKGTPEERWDWLQELTKQVAGEAWGRGLDELTVWIPNELVYSFDKRLKGLGFTRSPWVSYSASLDALQKRDPQTPAPKEVLPLDPGTKSIASAKRPPRSDET